MKKTILISLVAIFAIIGIAYATSDSGTISSTNKYAYNENTGWINFAADNSNVVVTETGLTGYAWGENIGWISLNCSNDDSCDTVDYGITNDYSGALSGYAWGENVGWVNFNPDGSQVVIDADGYFTGYAWGENIGWISFNCDNDDCETSDYKVQTTWRADSTAPTISAKTATTTANSSTITWTTNEVASSKIQYGLTTSYGTLTAETDTDPRVTSHSITLSSLASCATYHYKVISTDVNSNTTTSTDSSFITSGCGSSAPVITQTQEQITNASGGSLSLNEVTLTVPAGLGSDIVFQANRLNSATALTGVTVPSEFTAANSHAYELNAFESNSTAVSTFNSPLTVTISYSEADISGLQESSLKIFRLDGSSWHQLSNCSINTSANTITCETSGFSIFAILGNAITSSSNGSGGGGETTSYNPINPNIIINNGSLETNNPIVTLNLSADNMISGYSPLKMRISNKASFEGAEWIDYSTSPLSWNLDRGIGEKKVYVQFQNSRGTSISTFDTIKFTGISNSSNTGEATVLPDTTLIKSENASDVYYLENGKKRPILSGAVFDSYGFKWEDVVTVDNIENYPEGDILANANYRLVKYADSPKVYLIENNQKRWIASEEIFIFRRYGWGFIETIANNEEYSDGDDINSKIMNGDLMKYASSPKVYLIENNQKRWISSEEAFNNAGYLWSDIYVVNDGEFTFSTGENINE
jgi:hypothetical protein